MNKLKFEDSLQKYLAHCKTSTWVQDELYKFNFANWLTKEVQLRVQPPERILARCIESQQQDFTPEGYGRWLKGVQFLWKSGRETLKEFINLDDARAMKRLAEGAPLDEGLFMKRAMSYTALSAWLGTLLPDRFIPVPSVDFHDTITWLFDLNQFPKADYTYFLQAQEYFRHTKEELRQYGAEIEPLFLPHITTWRRQHNINQSKPRLHEYDWNWVTEDYHLYLFRVHLGLYEQPGTKKAKAVAAPAPEKGRPEIAPTLPEPLELYQPTPLPAEAVKSTTAHNPPAEVQLSEQDYLEQHRRQMEIGARAEQIVLENEKAYLQRCGKPWLSEQVRIVSGNPMLGFDVLSWEPDGAQKQIEVKAIGAGVTKTFFITANELGKSQELSNYFIYCVEVDGQGRAKIIRLAKPDLSNQEFFRMECISYRVTFS